MTFVEETPQAVVKRIGVTPSLLPPLQKLLQGVGGSPLAAGWWPVKTIYLYSASGPDSGTFLVKGLYRWDLMRSLEVAGCGRMHFSPSFQEAEVEGSGVQGQPQLHETLSLKKKN